jgi:1-acyl-sn-glycerol-3-phosphate acyltransferase
MGNMKSGLLYRLIRPFARIAIGLYFRKIHISGLEKLPLDGPLILACNHPNSFTEACILATYQPRILHFLVRGDVFKNKVIAFLLGQTNQIPIFRFKDGFSGLKQNESSFSACYKKLKEGAAILIFSEASSVFEKRLRPIQKGTARLAFGACEKYNIDEDFHIIPIGVNYTQGDRFRTEVMINFGDPIKVNTFLNDYRENPKKSIDQVTSMISNALKNLVIQIRDHSNDKLYNDCMELLESQNPYDPKIPVWRSRERYDRDSSLAKKINNLNEPDRKSLVSEIQKLKNMLPKSIHMLSDLQYLDAQALSQRLLSWLFFPIALPGLLYFFVPFYLARFVAIPFLRHREYYTGVRLATMLILGLLQGISLLTIGLLMQWFWLVAGVILIPFLAWFAVMYLEYSRAANKAGNLKKSKHIQDIRAQYNLVLSLLDQPN